MASTANVHLGRDLGALIGTEYVCEEAAPLTAYSIDGVKPGAWVLPGSVEEIAAVVRFANERKLSLVVAGGFTHQSNGNPPSSVDVLLRTERLNSVLHFDAGDLTIGVEAGCKIGDICKKVAADSLLLPLEVAQPQRASIGGALATASSGALKHGYGGAREYCIGVSYVTGDGRIAKAGGRVVKNVAGYDVMKLMIGSFGSLGVITSANFKLFAAPKQTRTFVANFESVEGALEFRDAVQRSPLTPMCLELISARAHAYLNGGTDERWTIAVRAAGSDAVLVRYRKELGGSVAKEESGENEGAFWLGVREFDNAVLKRHQNAMTVRIHVPPSDLETVLKDAEQAALNHNMLFGCVARVGVATVNGAFIPLSVDPPAAMQYADTIAQLRKSLSGDASAIVTHCPREAKAYLSVWGEPTGDVRAMRAVKQALDPNGIMNRGRFLF